MNWQPCLGWLLKSAAILLSNVGLYPMPEPGLLLIISSSSLWSVFFTELADPLLTLVSDSLFIYTDCLWSKMIWSALAGLPRTPRCLASKHTFLTSILENHLKMSDNSLRSSPHPSATADMGLDCSSSFRPQLLALKQYCGCVGFWIIVEEETTTCQGW